MNSTLAQAAVTLRGTHDFDFCQTTHPWFRPLVEAKGGHRRAGLCGALTLEWLRWRKHSASNRTDYPAYVSGPAVAEWVRTTVNRLHGGWNTPERVAIQAAVMRPMGFTQQGEGIAFPPAKFDRYVAAADFGVISMYNATASHAVGLYIPNNGTSITGVHFFDSNEGGVSFPDLESFFKWWKAYVPAVVVPMLGGSHFYRLLNYVPSS